MSKDTMDSHNQIIICFNMDKKLCDNNEFDDKFYYSGGRLWMDFNLSLIKLGKKKVYYKLLVDIISKREITINMRETELF